VTKNVKLEVRPLFLPHLIKLSKQIEPGLTELDWVSKDWQTYVDVAKLAIHNFKELVRNPLNIVTIEDPINKEKMSNSSQQTYRTYLHSDYNCITIVIPYRRIESMTSTSIVSSKC